MATAATPITIDAAGRGIYSRDRSAATHVRYEVEQRPFLVSDILHAVQTLFSYRAHAKRLSFDVSLPVTAHDAVIGDEKLLLQVLCNLVGNAVKFTTVGGIEIAAKQHTLGDGSLLLTFAVKDTGPGIGPKRLAHIFTPSVDLGAPSNAGLAVSAALVRAMGGTLEVTSIPGEGSIFAFYIRVVRAH